MHRYAAIPAMLLVLAVSLPAEVLGHGYAGKRLFPQTMTFDDPAPLDELNLFVGRVKTPGVLTTSYTLDTAKRITPWWSVGFSQEIDQLSSGSTGTSGFQNFALHTKGTFLVSARHETLISWGLDWDIGGIGSPVVGASTQSTLTPQLFFGKGLGDLPASLDALRPLAITGYAAPSFPLQQGPLDTMQVGFTVQYSLPYLTSFVRDVGLWAPFRNMVPLVEVLLSNCLNQACETTGTINPGAFWFVGGIGQLGMEASIPINDLSGRNIGALAMGGLYLDDLFPHSLGAPLLGPLFE